MEALCKKCKFNIVEHYPDEESFKDIDYEVLCDECRADLEDERMSELQNIQKQLISKQMTKLELRNQIIMQNLPMIEQHYTELLKNGALQTKIDDRAATIGDYAEQVAEDSLEIANAIVMVMDEEIGELEPENEHLSLE